MLRDVEIVGNGSPTSVSTAIDQPPRCALTTLSADDQAACHVRYCPQVDLDLCARATLANVERELRASGAEVTIHALWVALVDRAGRTASRT